MRIKMILLISIFLLLFVGCEAQEKLHTPLTEMESGIEENVSVDSPNAADSAALEADAEPLFFSSVEEMTEAVRTERQAKAKDIMAQINELESLSVIYAPRNEMTGYELQFIEVKPNRVFYRYAPVLSEQAESTLGNEIIITLYRNEEASFGALCDQHGITPDEDGFAYREGRGKMYFEQDGMAICIEVPEHLNDYDTIRSLCEMEKIEIP